MISEHQPATQKPDQTNYGVGGGALHPAQTSQMFGFAGPGRRLEYRKQTELFLNLDFYFYLEMGVSHHLSEFESRIRPEPGSTHASAQ